MFDPSWDEGCPHCSFWADNFNAIIVHLNHRDVTMVAVSRAPYSKLTAYQKRMGWDFKWFSSYGTDFNYDYHVSFTQEKLAKNQAYYNYIAQASPSPELQGVSVLLENGPKVAFVGDLVFNGHHPYIADDHILDWLKNLDKARDLLANTTTIYPGHGKSGSIDLIDSQKKYLLAYIDAVKELSGGKSMLTEEEKGNLTQRMEEFLPGGGLSFLIAQSADPVAAELAKNR
jgi:hypothetical protein